MRSCLDRIKFKFSKRNSDSFIKYLKKHGCKIGENTHFHDPQNTFIDVNRLEFIEIGKNCNITMNTTILAHDYSYKVCRNVYHDMPQKAGITKIGNNVFIGINSIILMGSKIGNNVIVGAGSVVSGIVPDNCVIAGNPAKVICTLEQYHLKCCDKFEEGAILHAKRIIECKKRMPTLQEMMYYIVLFCDKSERLELLKNMFPTGDDKNAVIEDLMKIDNKYKSFEEFLEKCGVKIDD